MAEITKQHPSRSQNPSRPSFLRRMISITSPAENQNAPPSQEVGEGTALLAGESTEQQYSTVRSRRDNPLAKHVGLAGMTEQQTSASRPILPRSATTSLVVTTQASSSLTSVAQLSRPILTRAAATTDNLRPALNRATTAKNPPARPSLFRRVTDSMVNSFDLDAENSYTHRNKPPQPSHWHDHAHRAALIKTWDAVSAGASSAKYPKSITAQVVSTEKGMLEQLPELGEGVVTLDRNWIEYVLGMALRAPFDSAEKMGRWEMLATSSGSRACWGPW